MSSVRDDGRSRQTGNRLLERNSAPPARLALLLSHPAFRLPAAGSPGAGSTSGGKSHCHKIDNHPPKFVGVAKKTEIGFRKLKVRRITQGRMGQAQEETKLSVGLY